MESIYELYGLVKSALENAVLLTVTLCGVVSLITKHFLAKDIAEHKRILDEQIASHKQNLDQQSAREIAHLTTTLQLASDVAVARIQSDLRVEAFEREKRLELLHQERAKVILDLYKNVLAVQRETSSAAFFAYAHTNSDDLRDGHNAAVRTLRRFYEDHALYFVDELEAQIERYISSVHKHIESASEIGKAYPFMETPIDDQSVREAMTASYQEAGELLASIRSYFQQLMMVKGRDPFHSSETPPVIPK